jgi:hypothetical protein
LFAIFWKSLESLVPTVVTAVMMTSEINAAMSPYSIDVAPELSARKVLMDLNICFSLLYIEVIATGQTRDRT